MSLLRDDVVRFGGDLFTVMSVTGSTVLLRRPDGGCDAVDLATVDFVSRPKKAGAHFRSWLSETVASYAVRTKASEVVASAAELDEMGFETPATPAYSFWREEVQRKRRCGICWRVTRGTADAQHHALNHQTRFSLTSEKTPAQPANLRMKGESNGKR